MISFRSYSLPDYPFDFTALLTRTIISLQRKVFADRGAGYCRVGPRMDAQKENDLIHSIIASGKPCLLGKIGTNDGEALLRYLDISDQSGLLKKSIGLILGRNGPFWWDNSVRGMLCGTAGVFPATTESLERFCQRFLDAVGEMDVFLTWVYGEKRLFDRYCQSAVPVRLDSLTPIRGKRPWYSALAGRRVLVIHQYAKTIAEQYPKREKLFDSPDFIPRFTLLTYRPVSSFGGIAVPGHANWESALDRMIEEVMDIDFDVALIGAGGYGIPLGAAIKRSGRQAVHTGGATQLLFGIKGGRWDRWGVYNEYWVRPKAEDVPPLMGQVENGCFV